MTPELARAVKRCNQWFGAYWNTHPLIMAFIAIPIRRRIKTHRQVLVRVRPDKPNPLASVTDPVV